MHQNDAPIGQSTRLSTLPCPSKDFPVIYAAFYVGGTSITQAASYSAPLVNHMKIVITAMDSATAKGTFSGDLFLNGDFTAAKKTVTSGDFYAKFQ